MFSVARIPFFIRSFIGFISFIKIGDKFYRFATYTGAKIKKISYEGNKFEVVIQDKKHKLNITAFNTLGLMLKAPKNGIMDRDILESVSAVINVSFSEADGAKIFEGKGINTGMEISGDVLKYFK
jgi:hypothetical protein